jgi:hypothetical protein
MAAAERIDRGYLGRLLQLTLLAPDTLEFILDGRQPPGLSLPGLLEPFPLAWDKQRSVVADAARELHAVSLDTHLPEGRPER